MGVFEERRLFCYSVFIKPVQMHELITFMHNKPSNQRELNTRSSSRSCVFRIAKFALEESKGMWHDMLWPSISDWISNLTETCLESNRPDTGETRWNGVYGPNVCVFMDTANTEHHLHPKHIHTHRININTSNLAISVRKKKKSQSRHMPHMMTQSPSHSTHSLRLPLLYRVFHDFRA
jgi:hypothetical protein